MSEKAPSLVDSVLQFARNNKPMLANAAALGGIGALTGFVFTPKKDENETASSRFKRRLKSALLGASVAGGAGALFSSSYDNFSTAKPVDAPTPSESITDAASSPWTAAASAAGGGLAGRFMGGKTWHGDLAAREIKANNILANLARNVNAASPDGVTYTAEQLKGMLADASIKQKIKDLDGRVKFVEDVPVKKLMQDTLKGMGYKTDSRVAKELFAAGMGNMAARGHYLSKLQGLAKRNWRTAAFAAALGSVPLAIGYANKEN